MTRQILRSIEPAVLPLHDQMRFHPGRPAQLSFIGLLAGLVLTDFGGHELSIENVKSKINAFPSSYKKELGITGGPHRHRKNLTYRQVSHAFHRLCHILRCDNTSAVSVLDKFSTDLLENQVDSYRFDLSKTAAFDGTVMSTWALLRFRRKDESREDKPKGESGWKAYSADPDAKHGHYPAKGGRKAGFAMGYEAHLLTPLASPGVKAPTLVSGMAFQPNSTADRPAIKRLIISRKGRYDTVVYDGGYHFIGNNSFAELTEKGIGRVFEPVESLRKGPPASGAILIDGDIFSTCLPEKLRQIPAKLDKRSGPEAKRLNGLYEERDSYRYRRHAETDKFFRGLNPAHAGQLATKAVPESMNLPFTKPRCSVHKPGSKNCSATKTVNVDKERLLVNRQAFPFGTKPWLKIYLKGRSQVECANSNVRKNYNKLSERDWCRVIGRVPTGIMFLIKLLTTNAEAVRRFEYCT